MFLVVAKAGDAEVAEVWLAGSDWVERVGSGEAGVVVVADVEDVVVGFCYS